MSEALTEEQIKTAIKEESHSPEDIAAAFFSLEYPKYRAMLSTLSMNELIRLSLNLAAGEMTPELNQLKTDKERKAYYLGDQMIQNRSIMRLAFEIQKAEEAQAKEQENLKDTNELLEVQPPLNLTKGENNNGEI